MMYLLDTCVVSDFIKGDTNTLRHIKAKSPRVIAISSITSMEIEYGLALNAGRAQKVFPIYRDFLKVIKTLSFEEQDAVCCGKLRAVLKQQGQLIGTYDFLIASIAVNRNMILVSSNVREFSRINGLRLENWRE